MQKIDFSNNLDTIVERLQSVEILNLFRTGFSNPGQGYPYSQINPLLFLSKSNFDQLKNNERYSLILNSLNALTIYEEQNLSSIVTTLQQTRITEILTNARVVAFFNFHNALQSTSILAKTVLLSSDTINNFEESINNGIVIFQVVIEKEGLETEKYIKIFSGLQELIETISKILGESEQKPEIVLLDSGSDTNIGVKSGIETAKSLFLIFKEIWDFIINFRYYKQKQNNKALLDSLSIRAEISKRIEDGTITKEEGQEYAHMIKTRTDDLIGMKVLPKQIVIDKNQIENRKLLEEFEGLKMLTDGNN